jgi:serine/threonine-protein kinase
VGEVAIGERIKLLDFGIAKLSVEGERTSTVPGAILGAPTYMAPEQCRGVAVDRNGPR